MRADDPRLTGRWTDDYGQRDLTRADLDAMAAVPLPVEPAGKPRDLALVLENGRRIPIDVVLNRVDPDGTHWWRPVIDGLNITDFLPETIGVDAPQRLAPGHGLTFLGADEYWHTQEWITRIIENSAHVLNVGYRRGHG